MKITIIILLLLLNLSQCLAQKVDGIWISYDNYFIENNLGDDEIIGGNSIGAGYLIDFDNKTISHIRKDSLVNLNIDFKEYTLSVKSDTLISINFKIVSKDSLEIDFKYNMIDVFKPLDLSHELNLTAKQINDFLLKNDFEKPFGNLELEFSHEIYHFDRFVDEGMKRNKLINKTWNYNGYWYIRKIKDNFFLILNFDGMMDIKIFQILSFEKCKIKLNPISNLKIIKNSNVEEIKLKSCL